MTGWFYDECSRFPRKAWAKERGREEGQYLSVHFSAQRVGLPVPNTQFPDNSCIYMYVHCNLILSSLQMSAVCRALGKNILKFFLFFN